MSLDRIRSETDTEGHNWATNDRRTYAPCGGAQGDWKRGASKNRPEPEKPKRREADVAYRKEK